MKIHAYITKTGKHTIYMVTRIYAIYSRVMIKDDILMCVPFNEKKNKSFSMGEKWNPIKSCPTILWFWKNYQDVFYSALSISKLITDLRDIRFYLRTFAWKLCVIPTHENWCDKKFKFTLIAIITYLDYNMYITI